jgi:pimeloyl-ACP methyl ester carboxylesterase
MNEHVCQFGPDQKLVGIMTEPQQGDEHEDIPAVLMLNAGLLHHVGPHRMSVELSRRLADERIPSLRFDMGGYGDSEISADAQSDDTRTFSDIKYAIDYLEQEHGIKRCVVFGSCSGADNAHAIALRDPRVVGAVFLDGHGYWTFRSYLNHYLPRIIRPSVWANLARRLAKAPRTGEAPTTSVGPQLRRPFDPKLQVRDEIQSLAGRGMQMLYVYTGGVANYYNYANQFFDMFPGLRRNGKIEVEYFPLADHTYTFAEDRERMFTRVAMWYRSRNWIGN